MKKFRFLISNVLIVAMLAVIGFVSYRAYGELQRKKQIEKEIDSLRGEAEKIRHDNQDLSEKIAYFDSPEFQEWEAKSKLNFQKPDENVVIVNPSPSKENINSEVAGDSKEKGGSAQTIPNHIKWWNQFFR